jgi:hypothetical protein
MNATAQNMIEKKNELSAAGKSVVDLVASEAKQLDPRDLNGTAAELASTARNTASAAFDSTVSFVRRNPVTSALGLCAFSFLAGVLSGRIHKRA